MSKPPSPPVGPRAVRSVARNAGTVGFFTLLSRFGGLIRDATFSHVFGSSHVTDAYLMAFTIPNTFRTLVAEGSLTVAFLPVFRETEAKGGEAAGARLLAQAMLVFPGLAAIVAALAVLFAEPLVALFAAGYRDVPGKFEHTVELTKLMFAYLPLVSFVALAMGALNARRYFATSAASPLIFNVTVISGILLVALSFPGFGVEGVALAVIAGGASQVGLQIYGLRQAGLLVLPKPALSPEVRRILGLMLPALAALAVYQVNIVVVRRVASELSEGAVTYLFYADRFFQLPLGVFGIAIATASLPAFSDAHLEGGSGKLVQAFGRSVRLSNFIAVPATVGLFVLALPICATVMQHGEFTEEMSRATAPALQMLALGLVPVATIRVVSQVFFSLQDTRTPVVCSVVGVSTNLIVAWPLAQRFGHAGLALSLSLAAWTQLVVQLILLRRKLGTSLDLGAIAGRAALDGVAAAMMGGVAFALGAAGRDSFSTGLGLGAVLWLLAAVLAGVACYAGLALAFRSPEALTLAAALRRRIRR